MMTDQEVFTKVATHLLRQNAKSNDGGARCMYRGCGGMMCAIGVLIPDELYSKKIELSTASSNNVASVLIAAGVLDYNGSARSGFLCTLQTIHDKCNPSYWPRALKELADNRGLTMPQI